MTQAPADGDVPENLVSLAVPAGTFPGGWVLLQGRVFRRGGDYDARLYYDTGGGWTPEHSLPVPATAGGVIHELLRLPPEVRQVGFHPGRAARCEIGPLRLVAVGAWRRRAGMLRRVLAQFWTQSAGRRRQAGLTPARVLRDLEGAYQAAGRLRAQAAAPGYSEWIGRHDRLSPQDERRISTRVAQWRDPPYFHVLVVGEDQDEVRRTRADLHAQLFQGFSCTWARDARDGSAVEKYNGLLAGASQREWALVLQAGDALPIHALYWMACAAQSPGLRVIYADEDRLDRTGRRVHPDFKPDFSWPCARSMRFPGEPVALRADVLAAGGGVRVDDCANGCYDAVLRVLDVPPAVDAGAVAHIPAVLLHRRPRGADAVADASAMEAVRRHLARRGLAATVEPMRAGTWRVRYVLKDQPLVSVIVPTRDRLDLTRRCIESLRQLTEYSNYEILLVDNQSTDPEAIAWMREQAGKGVVRLLAYAKPFNYAAINNMAVRAARGALVCLLNNDTEVVRPDWLAEMVAQALQPDVHVVGAKLLYPDGLVQHGGDLVGVGGVANHANAWLDRDDPGPGGRALVAQEYSAVTAACLLTWRERYLALGGLDERHLPVAFNDVDYCLRVREAGGHVVWTPHAILVHHESATRGQALRLWQRIQRRKEARYMRRRWREALGHDPFHNPNLSHVRADFSLGHAPLIDKPWNN